MTSLQPASVETQMILAELRMLRDEMVSMHQETRSTLIALREMIDELHQVERRESDIEAGLEEVASRLSDAIEGPQPSLTTCSACGSDLERHAAENGILLICKACGHTAFVERRQGSDRRAVPERRGVSGSSALEGAPDPVRESFDWTRSS